MVYDASVAGRAAQGRRREGRLRRARLDPAAAPPLQLRPRRGVTQRRRDLPIEGMTCASCVRRIEKALNTRRGRSGRQRQSGHREAHVVFDPAQVTSTDTCGRREGGLQGRRGIPASRGSTTLEARWSMRAARTRSTSSGSARSTISNASGPSASAAGLVMMALSSCR